MLYKNRLQSEKPLPILENMVTLHNSHFESVRTVIARNRPHRGVLPLHLYDGHEQQLQGDSGGNASNNASM